MARDVDKDAKNYAEVLQDLFLEAGWDVAISASMTDEGECTLFVDPPGPLQKSGWATKGARIYVKADPRGDKHDTIKVVGEDRKLAAKVLDKKLGGTPFYEGGYALVREGRR
jgi:hypothetical protein